jgi:hypothetical protein
VFVAIPNSGQNSLWSWIKTVGGLLSGGDTYTVVYKCLQTKPEFVY